LPGHGAQQVPLVAIEAVGTLAFPGVARLALDGRIDAAVPDVLLPAGSHTVVNAQVLLYLRRRGHGTAPALLPSSGTPSWTASRWR
jgi:hypothetical protein